MEPKQGKRRTHAEVVVRTLLITLAVFLLLFVMELKTGWSGEEMLQSLWVVLIVFAAAMLRLGARDKASDQLWLMGLLAEAFAWLEKVVHGWLERLMHLRGTETGGEPLPVVATPVDGSPDADPAASTTSVLPVSTVSGASGATSPPVEAAGAPARTPTGSSRDGEEKPANWAKEGDAWIYHPRP